MTVETRGRARYALDLAAAIILGLAAFGILFWQPGGAVTVLSIFVISAIGPVAWFFLRRRWRDSG